MAREILFDKEGTYFREVVRGQCRTVCFGEDSLKKHPNADTFVSPLTRISSFLPVVLKIVSFLSCLKASISPTSVDDWSLSNVKSWARFRLKIQIQIKSPAGFANVRHSKYVRVVSTILFQVGKGRNSRSRKREVTNLLIQDVFQIVNAKSIISTSKISCTNFFILTCFSKDKGN